VFDKKKEVGNEKACDNSSIRNLFLFGKVSRALSAILGGAKESKGEGEAKAKAGSSGEQPW
jgi:hypothetical protein